MTRARARILAINGGSSSIRFALFEAGDALEKGLHGKIERIGSSAAELSFSDPESGRSDVLQIAGGDQPAAADSLIHWLEAQGQLKSIEAAGHRIVQGVRHTEPVKITPELLDELHRLELYDPDHLPGELALIQAFQKQCPQLTQVACFDSAFHRTMPRVATLLPIPRRYEALGVRRYGFHGLSFAYLLEELARVAGPAVAQGRVILAHLGSGASLAAVWEGKSIDTSMGFTPTAGLPMSTRAGDLDPGVAIYLARTEQMTPEQFYRMASHESGLRGVSETDSDMRDLLAREGEDVRAAEAVALFCYQAKKWIGAYAAALGGLETLVFAGGIGENAAAIRERICAGLGFLGLEIDGSRNAAHAEIVSTAASRVTARVMRTDEESMIARSVSRLLHLHN